MSWHLSLSPKTIVKDMGYENRNKEHALESMIRERCIPKEGMPHAHKACRNKICIPKEGMPHALRHAKNK